MKKISKIVLIGLVAFTLTGCFKKEGGGNQAGGGAGNMFAGKNSMKCVYEVNGQTVTTYVKGEKVRTEGVTQTGGNSSTGIMISDSEWMYSWDTSTKKGTKMNLKQIEEMSDDEPVEEMEMDEIPEDIQAEIKKMEEEFSASCKNEKIADSLFVPPTDVEFTDMSQGMEELNQLQEKWEDKTEYTQEDMDELNEAMDMVEDMMGQ